MIDEAVIKKRIAERIKQYREAKRISKRELSRRIGIDEKAIRRWEGDKDYVFMPSLSTLIKVCNALEIELSQLLC